MTRQELETTIETMTAQLKRNIKRLSELRPTPSLPSNERGLLEHIDNQRRKLERLNQDLLQARYEDQSNG